MTKTKIPNALIAAAGRLLAHARLPLVASILLLGLVGCHRGADDQKPVEHHFPAHRPADFRAAVQRLCELDREIFNDTRRRPEGQIGAYEEMRDVIRWLPGLAADSDMPEAEWNRVQAVGAALLFCFEPVRALGPEERHAAFLDIQSQVDSALVELVDLSKRSAASDEPARVH